MKRATGNAVAVERLDVSVYTIPTDAPESDGTMQWDSTTVVVVEATGGGCAGIGYTYGPAAVAEIITGKLSDVVAGQNALDVASAWAGMWSALRNAGTAGPGAMAVSAVDNALWDLKARLLDVPLVVALDAASESVPVYGSGGFCSYSDKQLSEQLEGWVAQGIPRVKMKVGRHPAADRHRLHVARTAIGPDIELLVDANGAYHRSEALRWADIYAEFDVRWLEEPVSSDDLNGLHLIRDRAPGGVSVAAGEYGWDLPYFQRMLDAEAVDCLQADVTRCGGLTAFQRVGALCDARSMELSGHCAPQLSAHACAAVWHLRHLEYFHDHIRIEHMLFDGCLQPQPGGVLVPDRTRPGNGLALKRADAEQWRIR